MKQYRIRRAATGLLAHIASSPVVTVYPGVIKNSRKKAELWLKVAHEKWNYTDAYIEVRDGDNGTWRRLR